MNAAARLSGTPKIGSGGRVWKPNSVIQIGSRRGSLPRRAIRSSVRVTRDSWPMAASPGPSPPRGPPASV
jgi:hypothetical protein